MGLTLHFETSRPVKCVCAPSLCLIEKHKASRNDLQHSRSICHLRRTQTNQNTHTGALWNPQLVKSKMMAQVAIQSLAWVPACTAAPYRFRTNWVPHLDTMALSTLGSFLKWFWHDRFCQNHFEVHTSSCKINSRIKSKSGVSKLTTDICQHTTNVVTTWFCGTRDLATCCPFMHVHRLSKITSGLISPSPPHLQVWFRRIELAKTSWITDLETTGSKHNVNREFN